MPEKPSYPKNALALTTTVNALLICSMISLLTVAGAFSLLGGLILFTGAVSAIALRQRNLTFIKEHPDLVAIFIALFLSLTITQLIRFEFDLAAFDGPLRLVLGIPLIVFFLSCRVRLVPIFKLSSSVSLILTCIFALTLNKCDFFISICREDRLTSSFLNPVNFGALTGTLASIALFRATEQANGIKTTANFLAVFCGVILLILNGTRASWIAFIVCAIIVILCMKKNKISAKVFCYLIAGIFFTGFFLQNNINSRISSAKSELATFKLSDPETYGSTGLRLAMWRASIEVIKEYPLQGVRDRSREFLENKTLASHPGVSSVALESITVAGPHNEALAFGIRAGIWGLLAYCVTYGGFFLFFLRHLSERTANARPAAIFGLIIVTNAFINSIFTEFLGLKMMYTFFSISVAIAISECISFDEGKNLRGSPNAI